MSTAQILPMREQVKALSTTLASLQLSSTQATDTEVAQLKAHVTQAEGLLRAKDKELERLRWAWD